MALILFFFNFLRSKFPIFSHRIETDEKKRLKAKKVGFCQAGFYVLAILCFFDKAENMSYKIFLINRQQEKLNRFDVFAKF